jgi:hypothetical protein
MNKDQVIAILKILKTSYPKFYSDMTKEDMLNTIDLWTEMFAHENPALVVAAVKNLINTFKWPPTIADVKDEMYKLTQTETETPVEMWNKIKAAMSRASYYAQEEFDKLPEVAKKFVGSPNQLREWALSIDYNDGVTKGQFFKQYEILKKREKDNMLMLPEVRNITKQLANNMGATKLLG